VAFVTVFFTSVVLAHRAVVLPMQDKVATLIRAANDEEDDFRLPLILLVEALHESDSRLGSIFLDADGIKDKLRKVLLRSPVYAATVDAAAWDEKGRRVVHLNNNKLFVYDLEKGKEDDKSSDLLLGDPKPLAPPSIGIITLGDGSETLVAFRNDSGGIFVGQQGSSLVEQRQFRLVAGLINQLPQGFFMQRAEFYKAARLRIITVHWGTNGPDKMGTFRISASAGPTFAFVDPDNELFNWQPYLRDTNRLPVLAEDCDQYGFLGNDDSGHFTFKLGQFAEQQLQTVRLTGTITAGGSLAFMRGCTAALIRDDADHIYIIKLPLGSSSPEPVPLRINLGDKEARMVTPRTQLASPMFAAAPRGADQGLRVGWLTRSGLTIADASPSSDWSLRSANPDTNSGPMLTGLQSGSLGSRVGILSLSPDGSFALVVAQQSFSSPAELRVFNLNFEVQEKKFAMLKATAALIQEACKAAKLKTGNNNLTPDELSEWLHNQYAEQPCHGYE
jgi:hypothetical protein